MTETDKVRWTIHRPGRTWTDLAHLASRFGVFRPASVTMKGDRGSLILRFAGGTTKPRPHINGRDNKCLAGPVMFIPYSKAPGSSPTSSNATREGEVFLIDPTDRCVSRIQNAIYERYEDKTISLHDPGLDGRLMYGGDFVGGTQREVQGVPGSIYLEGAKFTMRKYLDPDRPRYGTSQNTSMTATDNSGSQSRKRPSAADAEVHELPGNSGPKRQRHYRQVPLAGSSSQDRDHGSTANALGSNQNTASQPQHELCAATGLSSFRVVDATVNDAGASHTTIKGIPVTSLGSTYVQSI